MRPENQRMQAFLKANGIDAIPKYIKDGSCKHSWRLYGVTGEKDANGRPVYQKWWGNQPLIDKMNALGFVSLFNEKLTDSHGNGGVFSVLVRGHFELLQDIPAGGFKFRVGQVVNYTNDNGVNWGNRTIIGTEKAETTGYGKAYYIQPTDTPWYAVPERCLKEVVDIPAKNNIIPYTSLQTRRDIRANRAARANDRITKRNGQPMYY